MYVCKFVTYEYLFSKVHLASFYHSYSYTATRIFQLPYAPAR